MSIQRAAKSVTIDYSKSKIYRIVNDVNDITYVGSTTQRLCQRFDCHKRRASGTGNQSTSKLYVAMRDVGIDRFSIQLIEDYPCTNKASLQQREYEITNATSRDKLYNSLFDGKPTKDMVDKMKLALLTCAAKGPDNGSFCRGCLSHEKKECRYRYRWYSADGAKSKSFSYRSVRSQQAAYIACDDLRNEIYPLTFSELAQELPFANEC